MNTIKGKMGTHMEMGRCEKERDSFSLPSCMFSTLNWSTLCEIMCEGKGQKRDNIKDRYEIL